MSYEILQILEMKDLCNISAGNIAETISWNEEIYELSDKF